MTRHVARPLSLRLLGGFAVEGPDGYVALPTSAQRVVAYLALQDRPVQRTRLAGALWPSTTDGQAGANLRSALWRTRKVAPLIGDDHSGLTLSPGVDVDARWLRNRTDDAVLARVRGAPNGVSFDLELLPDWYDDWVIAERERFRQMLLRTFASLIPRLVSRGRADEAIDVGLHAVRLEPLCETSHQALIAAYLAAGDRGGALRQFDEHVTLLREELGLAPADATVALVRHLLPRPSRRSRRATVSTRR
jgi:DNA-binding SARP family transcriptional activator